jgi:hypothetical protein
VRKWIDDNLTAKGLEVAVITIDTRCKSSGMSLIKQTKKDGCIYEKGGIRLKWYLDELLECLVSTLG